MRPFVGHILHTGPGLSTVECDVMIAALFGLARCGGRTASGHGEIEDGSPDCGNSKGFDRRLGPF
jgi:hypothetical protein